MNLVHQIEAARICPRRMMTSRANRKLHAAVADGDVNSAAHALDCGANINQMDEYGCTPLLAAIFLEGELPLRLLDIVDIRLELVTLLLDRGADVNAPDPEGETPLHNLSRCNPYDLPYLASVLELLLDRGAAIDAQVVDGNRFINGYTPLRMACLGDRDRRVATVQLLLDRGADVNDRRGGHYRTTPISHAYFHQNFATVRVLLEYGARLDDIADGKFARGTHDENLAMTAFLKTARQRPVLPRARRLLTTWTLRIRLHVVGPRAENVGSARHRILGCRNLARHLVSFLSGPPPPPPHGASGLRGRLPKLAGFACVLQ